jgi:type VI secretion system protein ImpL
MKTALQRTDWRVLASALGIAAAAVLVWFLAPLIDVGGEQPLMAPHARLFAVAAMLALASAVLLAQRTLAVGRNRRFLTQLAQSEPGQREVAFLGKRFGQALQQLRSLHLARRGGARWLGALLGRPLVHELPWYVIIGAPGAGKTTVLLNSGLHFPLAEGPGDESVRGVGGTRNCDWWFASEAVLIDTAGRYTTQDSDRDADRTAWFGFLDLLRRHRPRCPINGVLLTLSANDLLQATPDRAAAHASDLRQRLDEITARLGIAVPVYVLVTKTDLLPGFTEFFADFAGSNPHVRSQVWGATLPHGAGAAQWRAEMDALEARLHEQMLESVGRERGSRRSAALHAFPAQWRQLNRSALELLHSVVTQGQDPRPMLRGLYFTSATQDAAPGPRGSNNSYFVTRLLRDVVFAESGLAGSMSRGSRQRRWVERGALAASALAVVAAAGFTWRGYEREARAVDAFATQLPQLDQALAQAQRNTDLVALLPALDALAGSGIDPAHDGDDLAARLLDRNRMLAAAADDSYQRLLKDALLPRIAARLEARLRQSTGEPAARTYETLRAYLMLFGGKHFDAAALRAYFANDWQLTLPENVSAAERAALLRHLDRLLSRGEVGAPSHADAGLVTATRARVQGVTLAQRAATRLRQQDGNAPRVAADAGGVLVRASGGALADLPPPRAAALSRARTQQVLAALA